MKMCYRYGHKPVISTIVKENDLGLTIGAAVKVSQQGRIPASK